MPSLTSLLPIAALLATLTTAQTVESSNCTTGLHIIVARASGEAQGEGIIGVVATTIASQIPGSDTIAVVYPATLNDYIHSETNGTDTMNTMIQQYVASCPDSKFAIMGYSQGAQVVGDVLCGTSEPNFPTTSPLPSNYSNNFVAAVQMGDPSYVPGLSFDNGTSTTNGVFQRPDTSSCDPWASRMVSYCDTGDFFCAQGRGSNAFQIHLSYVQSYGGDAIQFVVDKYRSANSTSSGSPTKTGGSSTPTGAAGHVVPPGSVLAAAFVGAVLVGLS